MAHANTATSRLRSCVWLRLTSSKQLLASRLAGAFVMPLPMLHSQSCCLHRTFTLLAAAAAVVCSDPLCVWRLLYSDTEPSAECMRHKHDVILAVIGCPAALQALSMLRGTHLEHLLIRVVFPLAGAGVLQRLRDVASLGPFRTISTATGAASTEPAPVVATQAS